MSEEALADDQSHYEISLTGGQAFVGFVLLLLSLAASFAFGLVIGRGQIDEKFARKEPSSMITEGSATTAKVARAPKVEQIAATDDDFKEPEISETTAENEVPAAIPEPVEDRRPRLSSRNPPAQPTAAVQQPRAVQASSAAAGPHYAQLLSTGDKKRAEALAVKLIEGGFASAYVERGATDKGDIFRVRVRFPSESDARVAEPKLKTYVPEVWITREGR